MTQMKLKTTRKAIVESANGHKLLSAGYCELQNLLRGVEPFAYAAGTYGWNFDAYKVLGATVCTGYRGMPGRRAKNARDYDLCAALIWDDLKVSRADRMAALEALREEFVRQA